MRTVLTFGTFDGLHPGHMHYLAEAKKYGDRLVVVIARDETVKEVKGKLPKYNEKERLHNVRDLKIVDHAVLGSLGNKLDIVLDALPDIICLGYDQNTFTEKLREKLQQRGLDIPIIRLRAYRPDIYKSSRIK